MNVTAKVWRDYSHDILELPILCVVISCKLLVNVKLRVLSGTECSL
jgi:hypothetical protein